MTIEQLTRHQSELPERMETTTVEVPLDYADPGGERLSLAVSRLPATGSRRGVLFCFTGGPGGNDGLGLEMYQRLASTPLNEIYDFIGFDPRGYGRSAPQLCCEVTPKRARFSSRPADADFPQIAADMRDIEDACRRGGGDLRRHVNTRNIARDIDAVRRELGEEKINFIGYAYGTYVGAVYGQLFPGRLDRSVFDSCVHPQWPWRRQFMMQAAAMRRNVDAWAAWVGERSWRFDLGSAAAQVMAEVEAVSTVLAEQPRNGVDQTVFDGAVGNAATDRAAWEELADLVAGLSARAGDAGAEQAAQRARVFAGQGLRNEARGRAADTPGPAQRPAVLEAVTCEADWPTDLETYYADMRRFRERYPYGYGVMRAQPWVGTFRSFTPPEPPTRLGRARYPTGLVVQAEGNPLDHSDGARAMAGLLGHHLVWVADDGGHELYPNTGNPTVNGCVTRYLMTGELPPPLVVCGGTPRPDIPADS